MTDRANQQFGGEWTERKLDALTAYLIAYKKALSKQKFKLEYIDAFAGTGYRELAEYQSAPSQFLFPELSDSAAQQYLDGSAGRALQLESPFDAYKFVELDSKKASELKKLKQRFPALAPRISVVQEDANLYLLRRAREDWRAKSARAVVFIDPFGMQVDWTTVEALAKTEAVDLWLLYPVSAINRLLSSEGVRFEAWKERLNRVFGDEGWIEACYRKRSRMDLFEGPTEEQVKTINLEGLTEYMVRKLQGVFAGVVKKPLVLRSKTGNPLFALCFAAANKKGARIACSIASYIVGK